MNLIVMCYHKLYLIVLFYNNYYYLKIQLTFHEYLEILFILIIITNIIKS